MLDLGIEPYLLSSSLLAVMAQRLIRQVCGDCVTTLSPTEDEVRFLQEAEVDGKRITELATGQGCEKCRKSGYRGRLGIFELLTVDDAIRDRIQNRANATTIREEAVSAGMRLLREDGIEKVSSGVTTVSEVQRVTMRATM